ncbi:MAG: sugar ABC transporter permease [candidate division NC10 bacterium]|nr:sugar ABC transporter permease [candidate division NC10 bacterium]MBI3120898.1 sugar ABC transporter permease [candidate division NC10 bacterium]
MTRLAAIGLGRFRRASRTERREWLLALILLTPALVMLGLFVAYPFVRGIWLGLLDSVVGREGDFVGLRNYVKLWNDDIFRRAAANTFIYTGFATSLKLTLGMIVALMLNNLIGWKRILRASMLLPWIVPTVLSTLAWKWMFDPTFSIVNWILYHLGFIRLRIDWLGGPVMAMGSVILVNVWRGTPFFAITLLAGLQTINPDVYEAASIDGANPWQRFWRVTWPLLMPVTTVVMLFSVIQTFADFQLVYILTGGGPANSTHLFATYAYQIGVATGKLGEGAAASLAMFPFLFLVVIFQLWYIRRGEGGRGSA